MFLPTHAQAHTYACTHSHTHLHTQIHKVAECHVEVFFFEQRATPCRTYIHG